MMLLQEVCLAIDGVMIPAGTSTVYDQMLGSNIRRPFLHVRYRASETEDRRFKAGSLVLLVVLTL